MTLTLLLDLDDTLLENNMDTFLPAYLKGLGGRLASFVEPDRMVRALLAATGKMVQNTLPNRTLEATFDASFYPAIGIEKDTVRPALDAYYTEDFPKLKALTRPHPQAVALIEKAFATGCRVGIATNPLFPRTAIEQRIAWAGLANYPFTLIPSYETFHFAKPNPAFLTEFMAQMGWPDGPVLMVGNDLENDYASARQAGIAMYWVQTKKQLDDIDDAPSFRGSLSNLVDMFDQNQWEQFQPDISSPTAYKASLRATPAALNTLAMAAPAGIWTKCPQPKGWVLNEIMCHLRDAEIEVNLPRIQKIIRDDAPFLAGVDTDAWVSTRQYVTQDGQAALQAFIAARIETLALLESIPIEAWQRPARHAIFGPTTLQELVSVIDRHDHLHIRQAKENIHHFS